MRRWSVGHVSARCVSCMWYQQETPLVMCPRIHFKAMCKITGKVDLPASGSCCQYLLVKVINTGLLWRKANFVLNNSSQSVISVYTYLGHSKICCIGQTPKWSERQNGYSFQLRFYVIMVFILTEPNSCIQPRKMLQQAS